MANLLNQNIGTNYKGILNLNTLNGNLSGTLQAVTDGDGNASPLTLSTGEVGVSRTIALGAGSSNVRLINETYTINNSGAQTGTATGIFLNATETALNGMGHNLMDLQMNSVSRFSVSRLGALTAEGITSNSNIIAAGTASYQWLSRSRMNSPSDGVITLLNNGSTDFSRLQFGGTTNAFPAIKRNGAGIDFVLASDTGFCGITAGDDSKIRGLFRVQDLAGNNKGLFYPEGLSGVTTFYWNGSIGVGVLGNNASARLQVDSTTQGFLPPRMTTTQVNAIATPAEGLVVFNTTISHLCVYQSGAWVRMSHSPM
jgi:hypothetical protein